MHRVDSAIRQNPHLTGHQVFCQHEQGIVVLHGRVQSFFQKQMAQEALKRLEGVEKVINELEVEWMGRLGGPPAGAARPSGPHAAGARPPVSKNRVGRDTSP